MRHSLLLFLLLASGFAAFGQCTAPTNLSASWANNVSTFMWDAVPGATKYRIQFKFPGAFYTWDSYVEYEDSTTTNSISFPGILLSSTYDWRVRTECGSTSVSAYTQAPTSFTVPCPQPTNLNATNITGSSATLNWQHDPAAIPDYQAAVLSYRRANVGASWVQVNGSAGIQTGMFNLTGLLPGTTYEWCVNQICPYFYSPPSIHTFTTTYPTCGVASLWLPSNVGQAQATLNWTAVPNAANYFPEYKAASATAWTALAPTTSLSATITGLTASTGYQWRIKTECINNINTGVYSGVASFTTAAVPPPPPVACGTPATVTISNIGNRAATATWTAVPNATAYQFWQKIANGSTSWVGYTVNATTYTRTTYLMNTTYQYKVRAVCGTTNGAYTPDGTFTTLNCVSTGDNAYEWIDLFSLGSINRTSGAEPGGYANTGQSTNLTIGSTNNAGQISAATAGNFRNQNYAVFIDFNRNGSYEDSGERVAQGNINNANTINFTLNVPGTATAGVTGLRVIMAKQGGPAIVGCQSGFQGETEDYTVNLVAPSARISAEATAEPLAEVSVYPNPTDGLLQVRIPAHLNAQTVEILNSAGSPVRSSDVAGQESLLIDVSKQPSGLYFLSIFDAQGQRHVKKFIKQ